jgi:hypothetical protein
MPGSIALAGWLFADLLLASTVIFLVAAPGNPAPPPAKPLPTSTPATTGPLEPTPTTTPTPTPACEPFVVLEKTEATVRPATAGTIPTTDELRAALSQYTGRTAGLVNIFVHSPRDGEGQAMASEVMVRLQAALPETFRPDTIYEFFDWKDANTANTGTVELWMYFRSQSC